MLQPEQAMDGGGRVESVSSAATSPAVDEYGIGGGESNKRSRKSLN